MTGTVGDTPRQPVILDCDPGHDDAIAILLAAGSPALDLVGITPVAGNVTVDRATANAGRLCAAAGLRDVPIAPGAARPLLRALRTADGFHGETGLDGLTTRNEPLPASPLTATDLIVRTSRQHPGELVLVATGPLTNIATAFLADPALASRVARVVLMGGTCGRGNIAPTVEYNISVDPEAAAIVLDAPWDVFIVGLDVTTRAVADAGVRRRFLETKGEPARMVLSMLDFLGTDPVIHDPCAVAAVIADDVVQFREAFVAVETSGRWTSGTTVIDFDGQLGHAPNAKVGTTLDVGRFWSLVADAVARLGRPGGESAPRSGAEESALRQVHFHSTEEPLT